MLKPLHASTVGSLGCQFVDHSVMMGVLVVVRWHAGNLQSATGDRVCLSCAPNRAASELTKAAEPATKGQEPDVPPAATERRTAWDGMESVERHVASG